MGSEDSLKPNRSAPPSSSSSSSKPALGGDPKPKLPRSVQGEPQTRINSADGWAGRLLPRLEASQSVSLLQGAKDEANKPSEPDGQIAVANNPVGATIMTSPRDTPYILCAYQNAPPDAELQSFTLDDELGLKTPTSLVNGKDIRHFRIDFENSIEGREAQARCYRSFNGKSVNGYILTMQMFTDAQRPDTNKKSTLDILHQARAGLATQTASGRSDVLPTNDSNSKRGTASIASVDPRLKLSDKPNLVKDRRGSFIRTSANDGVKGDGDSTNQETTVSSVDPDKVWSGKVLHKLNGLQANGLASYGRSKLAVNDDTASSVSGVTASDMSRSRVPKCHVCDVNLSTGAAVEVKCTTCPRRYHGHCLPGQGSVARTDTGPYRCPRCLKHLAKGSSGISSSARDPANLTTTSNPSHVAKRQKLDNESGHSVGLSRDPPGVNKEISKPDTTVKRHGFERDQSAAKILYKPNRSVNMGSESKTTSTRLEKNSLNSDHVFDDERPPRATSQSTTPVFVKSSRLKNRITTRPSKPKLVPCRGCGLRSVPLLPSGSQSLCVSCKDTLAAGKDHPQLKSVKVDEFSLNKSDKTQHEATHSTDSTRSDPVREIVRSNNLEQPLKLPSLIKDGKKLKADRLEESSVSAVLKRSSAPDQNPAAETDVDTDAMNIDADTDAMDVEEVDTIGLMPLERCKDYDSVMDNEDSPKLSTKVSENSSKNTAFPSNSQRTKLNVTSKKEEVGLCDSLFAEWPEFRPSNQSHRAVKMAEISSRPRRKEWRQKSTLWSPLGNMNILESWNASTGDLRDQGMHIAESGKEVCTRTQDLDGRVFEQYDNVDDFLGIKEDLVITVRDGKVCYRDRRQNEHGEWCRTRNVYPAEM